VQDTLDFDVTGERREQNTLINDIRREVERWRASNWNGVTPYTRKLLMHWAPGPHREDPVLFCQREAAETAIFLTEIAGRHGTADYRRRLQPENDLHNDGLPRLGLKMATGTGKTVVMAMLVAWQTVNKVFTPKDSRFAKRFLVVTPGITIRDRLGVLHPEREDNYYRERDVVPTELWEALLQAQIEIVNYHAFLPRDAKEIQGVSSNTRKLLRGGRPELADAFRETPGMVAARVLRGLGIGKGEICPNTVVSKLVFDWIAGREVDQGDETTRLAPGNLPLLSNVEDGLWTLRQRTILVDSAQLESGEPLGADFRKDAAREIDAFKQAYRLRNPGADVDKLTDADLLREAMNTIGKKGKLGEHIRCVVSVAMLTEGWDANTVTHVLGIRPFRSQLLCEQVVGRGLRRRSYAVDESGRFAPEYAEIYGVPFAFIPGDRQIAKAKDPRPAVEVRALDERWDMRIAFPKLDGYRIELPDEPLHADFDAASHLHVDQSLVALWVENRGVVGEAEVLDLEDIRSARPQHVAFAIAKTLVDRDDFFAAFEGAPRPWLFPQLVDICRRWLDTCVTTDTGVSKGLLLLAQARNRAAERVFASIVHYPDNRQAVLMPVIRRFDPSGSTDDVRFLTRKVVMDPPPEKSHLNHVILDGVRGNSWEEKLAGYLEADDRVAAYAKNDHVDFTIPYTHAGRSHDYIPDFLVRLVTEPGDVERTLIVEVSGSRKSPGPTAAKADTARNQWCAAVNNWGQFGRWGYVEISDMTKAVRLLGDAIDNLYADRPVIGLPA
jgi:hypothetical protein